MKSSLGFRSGRRHELETDWRYPNVVTTVTDPFGLKADWGSLWAVADDDESYADVSLLNGKDSDVIIAGDFGFSIPSGATITFVQVQTRCYADPNMGDSTACGIFRNVAAGTGAATGIFPSIWPTAEEVETQTAIAGSAGSFDPIDPALINGSAWGFRLGVYAPAGDTTAYLRYIRMKVGYIV